MKNKGLAVSFLAFGLLFSSLAAADALHRAAYYGQLETVQLLLDQGADINQLGRSMYEYGAPLHLAVRQGHGDVVRLLIERGADVEVVDHNDLTPLHNAAWNGNLDLIKVLLEAGADIRATTYDGHTVLSCALENKQGEAARFIETLLQPTPGLANQ